MPSPNAAAFKYSVIIPAFNSEGLVGETIDRTLAFFECTGWRHEIILINDGSADGTWNVIAKKARINPNLTAINLRKNYGQHTAVFCGMRHATGDFIITMDDDLQNPPEEIARLVAKVLEGYDVVFGRFRVKRHTFHRRIGSRVIRRLDRQFFGHRSELAVTNFRIIRKDVVTRMLAHQTRFPYITGLVLMFSRRPADVGVEHRPRQLGRSTYRLAGLLRLVTRILFNYSTLSGLMGRALRSAAVLFAVGGKWHDQEKDVVTFSG